MNYLLYSLCFFLFALTTVAFATRAQWLPHLRQHTTSSTSHLPSLPDSLLRRFSLYTDNPTSSSSSSSLPWTRRFSLFNYSPIPPSSSTFHDDAAAGLHSSTFDLSGNIEAGDERSGLDEEGKREVLRVMRSKRVGFDEARRLVMVDKFKKAGVSVDGIPRDPKFVSFS